MSFEEYMRQVIAYMHMGGVSWESSYVRVLETVRPDLGTLVNAHPHMNPAVDISNFPAFMFYVFSNWH